MRLRSRLLDLPRDIGYGRGPRLMSRLRKAWVLFRHPHADIRFGRDVYLGPGFSLHIPGEGTFVAGDGVEFRRNFRAELWHGGRLEVGDGTIFTYDAVIQCSTRMEIGSRCLLGQNMMIVDGNHRFRDIDRPVMEQGYDYRHITIGDDVCVMSKVTIIASIGDRAFIGANSVVTKDIPPYSLAVGSPARVIEEFGPVTQA